MFTESVVAYEFEASEEVETTEDLWLQMQEFVAHDQEVQRIIRIKKPYITGLTHEDLNGEALVLAIEVYRQCHSIFNCTECNATNCNIFKINYTTKLKNKLYNLQNIPKRNTMISYVECTHDECEYPTHCRKDWNKELNDNSPVDILIRDEEAEQENEILRINTEKIRTVLLKMKDKERRVWEMYISGMDVREIAEKFGYKKVQGIYMLLKRSLYKVKRLS